MKNLGFIIIFVVVVASTLYTVLTGDSIGTNLHYNTLGRVVTGIVFVVILIYGIYSWRRLRELDRKIEARKAAHERN